MKLRVRLSLVSIVLGLAVLGFAAALASASPSTGQYDSTTVTTVTTTGTTGTTTESTTTTEGTTTTEETTTDQGTVAGVQGAGKGPTSGNAVSPAQQLQKTTSHATLPFTGQSLTWIVAAGVMLVLLGLALRRRGRSSSS
jgi:LPXTG-motif cell wall-anchored protein